MGVKFLLNKKLMILAIFVVSILAVSAVSAADANASDVNTMDSQVIGLADDMSDASSSLGQDEGSSEISVICVSNDNDSAKVSISNEDDLESDSNVLSASGNIAVSQVTINNILQSANNVKAYYNEKGFLPATVGVGGVTFTIHEFYYLMSKATSQISKSNTAPINPIMGVKAPSSKCVDTVYSAAVTEDKYVAIANADIDYITKNIQVRDHVDSVAGKIAYEDYVIMLARVLAYRYSNGQLPNYVSFFSNDPSKVHYVEEGELNPFGLYGKKVWIDADGGSDQIKWKIANALKALGWDVYVGDTYANAHYEDYLNAHPGYVLINIYNGFCAGTMRELVTDSIQNLLKTKHVVCIPVWDTSGWTNPEGMAPYRYGDFSGYSAKRAWDDDFSDLDPSIEDVDQFFRFYNVDYCASPTCELIINQFVKGGYYASVGDKKSTVISASDVSINYGVSANLIATLKDQNNKCLAGETLTILFDGGEYTLRTDSNGKISFSIPGNLVPGTYSVAISYEGSSDYKASGTDVKVTVNKAPVNIVADDVSMGYYDRSELVATLTNSVTGRAIGDVDVVFYIDGMKSSVKTDSKGQAKVSCANLVPGNYTASISYEGNEIYNSASTTAKVSVNKVAANIVSADVSMEYNDFRELVATLTDSVTGKAIDGVDVVFDIDGVKSVIVTDSKGQAKVSCEGLAPGNYTAGISYGGDGIYNPATTTAKITVNNADTSISAIFDKDAGELVATLTSVSSEKFIKGATVVVNFGGVKCSGKTDVNGQVVVSTADLSDDIYHVTVSYNGNSRYNPSSTKLNIIIGKINTDVSVDYYREFNEIVATLTNVYEDLFIKGATVVVNVGGVKYSGKTDVNGQIVVSIAGMSDGEYTVTASYKGNDKYNPSNTTLDIKVGKINTNLVIDDVFAVYGDVELVAALINEETGEGIKGANVGFVIDDVKYIVKTDSNGEARLALPDLVQGNYTATVSYEGNIKYNASDATFNVEVNKISTSISLYYDSSTKELVATLINTQTGRGISGANVVFNLNGVKTSVKTDKQGHARLAVEDSNLASAGVRYGGNSKYLYSTATAKIQEGKIPTVIFNSYDEQNGEVVATLTNAETGNAISGATVVFNFNKIKTAVKTNKQGQAIFSFVHLDHAIYYIGSSYGGNSKYAGSTTATNIVKI